LVGLPARLTGRPMFLVGVPMVLIGEPSLQTHLYAMERRVKRGMVKCGK